ncbi:alpha/beta hydrolase family protein [Calothrix sp. PCC 6303]|uniref:alpha/beta hydrolase family protein n=1 Tax=Calothrix sp. PCC 6303 TaxID=1170562 RepID=UPI0002A02BF7|nr:prolyl oligopeptidase family serine peptidase [Calothrix sp. PCC 6303]AFY99277.1 peptidase S9 prolyl oligopeptidase active site domain-containing protein [Calothrix sp. PCC 6303]
MDLSTPEAAWQLPPAPIAQILNASPPPTVIVSPNQSWLVELEQPSLTPIGEMAELQVPLAGLLLNPQTNAPARHQPYRNLKIKSVISDTVIPVSLPSNPKIGFLKWSPDSEKLSFTLTQATGLELWVVELATGITKKLTEAILNASYGSPQRWLNNDTLICKLILPERGEAPKKPIVPTKPMVEENLGRKTPSRTYTNLLETPHDEELFTYYLTSTLEKITLDGQRTTLLESALIHEAKASPDGNFILLTTIHRPFSYQLPVSFFPKQIHILDSSGKTLYQVADLPLADNISIKFDAVRTGRRRVVWRSDRAATVCWLEALDEGDPTQKVPHHDVLFCLDAPFTSPPEQIWQSEYRFQHVIWGTEDIAIVWEKWYDTRKQRIWQINPSQPNIPPQLLSDRSFEDKYQDPGVPLSTPGIYGRDVLRFTADGKGIYLSGRGASPQGIYPFIDTLDLETQSKQRLWQCQDPHFESVVRLLDDQAQTIITRRQSQIEPPNYYLKTPNQPEKLLTNYQDPAPQLAGIHKELVQYQRADGVKLSATLYLPPGYDQNRDGALATMFWVYPEEFKDREFAGQVTTATNTFSRPMGSSILFLLTQGYAVLSGPSIPIVGEGDTEPNDTYVEQLIAGTQAAVDYVVNRGIADPQRLGIGGHSYGAFTTVNLLAHSSIFKMGIARSGAYNRTLTPFGFQGEQRNFWEAMDTYINMSPFTHLEKIQSPLLLIHGEKDSNPGTYPLQTERLYEALKGLGATVRYCVLPCEDHSYRSIEGVNHVLWEMVNWCDRYLKPKA